MPFPINLESLLASGYVFARAETCPECREWVEVFTTPGKREIALNSMCELLRPAIRHYETCNIAPKQEEPCQATSLTSAAKQPICTDASRAPSAAVSTAASSKISRESSNVTIADTTNPSLPPTQIKLYGLTDKNMIAAGWLGGTLAIQFRYGKYHYANVAEDVFQKIRNNPFPNSLFVKLVKNHPELYPCTKIG
jgi:hypothetical protein